jgi:hypothetical protein
MKMRRSRRPRKTFRETWWCAITRSIFDHTLYLILNAGWDLVIKVIECDGLLERKINLLLKVLCNLSNDVEGYVFG